VCFALPNYVPALTDEPKHSLPVERPEKEKKHDREVYVAGNGRRPADVLLGAWDGRRDLAVDLTIVHPNPATGRPWRGSAATFLKDKGEQKNRESAKLCGRIGVDFSPMVFDT